MGKQYDFEEEAILTDQKLAEELNRLKPLAATRLQRVLPTRQDKERLEQLIQIVNSAQGKNEQVAALQTNMEELGGVIVTVLKEFL